MDYRFIRNDVNEAEAIFFDDHLVLGHFLTTELVKDLSILYALQHVVSQLESRKIEVFEWLGSEYKLAIDRGDVCITALVLDHTVYDELPESTALSDHEQTVGCGLSDFASVLEEWRLFLTNP